MELNDQQQPEGGAPNEITSFRGRILVAGTAVCMLVIGLTIWWLSPNSIEQEPERLALIPDFESTERPNVVAADGYVGSKACRKCHKREFSTWHGSYHRTMTQVATPETVVGDFSQLLTRHEYDVQLGVDEGRFGVTFSSARSDTGEPAETINANVVLCTGSHHMQAYWMSTGIDKELGILPFVWLIPEQRWVPRVSAFLIPPSARDVNLHDAFERGGWNRTCIRCHATHGQPLLGDGVTKGPQTTVAEFGISCEACHGPGETHVVSATRANNSQHSLPVVPPSLDHARSSEVCGQCHSVHNESENVRLELATTGSSYRPGDSFRATHSFDFQHFDPSVFWPDGMIRVLGREFNGLVRSPCFERGNLSCFSCHSMHKAKEDPASLKDWADDQLKPLMRTNHACLQCHEEYRSPNVLTAHTHHTAGSTGSECQNCHMPNTAYGLLKVCRSHQISNPHISETFKAGRPTACNLCHMDRSLVWVDEKLSAWYGQSRTMQPHPESDVSGVLSMALTADPGVRAMAAWHMGWEPARQASGDDWIPPFLAILMEDDYDAVRLIAGRTLRKFDGFSDVEYDAMAPPNDLSVAAQNVTARWREQTKQKSEVTFRPAMLIDSEGNLMSSRIQQLLNSRSRGGLFLAE
jgi:hypothetical protein